MKTLAIISLRWKIGLWTGLCLVASAAAIIAYAIFTARSTANAAAKDYAVEEVTGSARSLAEMAETFQRLVDAFKLSDGLQGDRESR